MEMMLKRYNVDKKPNSTMAVFHSKNSTESLQDGYGTAMKQCREYSVDGYRNCSAVREEWDVLENHYWFRSEFCCTFFTLRLPEDLLEVLYPVPSFSASFTLGTSCGAVNRVSLGNGFGFLLLHVCFRLFLVYFFVRFLFVCLFVCFFACFKRASLHRSHKHMSS